MTPTFLVSPAGDEAACPGRHHSPRTGQTDGADLPGHIDRLHQVHQGDVVGDVALVLLVDEPRVLDDAVHLVALLRRGNVQRGVHIVLSQTHAPVGGFIEEPGGHQEACNQRRNGGNDQ